MVPQGTKWTRVSGYPLHRNPKDTYGPSRYVWSLKVPPASNGRIAMGREAEVPWYSSPENGFREREAHQARSSMDETSCLQDSFLLHIATTTDTLRGS
eukprot:2606566-Prymnesium_polylepis.1